MYNVSMFYMAILIVIMLVELLFLSYIGAVKAQTQVGFYDKTCPNAEAIVKQTVQIHMQSDVTVAAGLLRLHFHDCFIQGCDGSILLNQPGAEKTAPANLGLRGFDVIDDAKKKIEATCPGVVSCADILALAAKDAVDLSGGPSWRVPLGRRDGRVSRAADATNMPSPLDTVPVLKQKFAAKGLSVEDLVVLNGAHTIGQTDCRFFSYRLYNYSAVSGQSDPSINRDFLGALQELCPASGNGLARVALDRGSQTTFDTSFFKNVNKGYGVLESDQRLMSDDTTASYVKRYGGLITGLLGVRFDLAFASSMQRMSNVDVKVGSQGEIRKVCSAVN